MADFTGDSNHRIPSYMLEFKSSERTEETVDVPEKNPVETFEKLEVIPDEYVLYIRDREEEHPVVRAGIRRSKHFGKALDLLSEGYNYRNVKDQVYQSGKTNSLALERIKPYLEGQKMKEAYRTSFSQIADILVEGELWHERLLEQA